MKPKKALEKLIDIRWKTLIFKKSELELSEEEKKVKLTTVNPLMEIIKKDAYCACQFAVRCIQGRWLDAEPYIMKNPKEAIEYFLRLHDKFEGRWKEAEPYILKHTPDKVFQYYDIFSERYGKISNLRSYNFPDETWIEAEPVFAKKINTLHKYVMRINKEFPLLEEKVLKNPNDKYNPKCIYEYASKILKRRWKEAEHIVMKCPDYAVKYCTKFNMTVPEEIHNKILSDVAFNNKKLTCHKKKYLDQNSKKKEAFHNYIKELINNGTITEQTTVKDLLNY